MAETLVARESVQDSNRKFNAIPAKMYDSIAMHLISSEATSMNEGSVSKWLLGLKVGDANAAQCLWTRYCQPLTELAKQRLKEAPKRLGDEEDLAQSVFASICGAAKAGRISDVKNRDELWWLLLAITKHKAISHIRRESAQKRGAGRTYSESALTPRPDDSKGFSLDQLIGDEPTPEFIVMLDEQHDRLLRLLRDERLRQIAVSRIEGFSVPEIAADLQVSTRSVERKLQLIRGVWSKELES